MPSARRVLQVVRSQGFGVVMGLSTVVLLAVGSVVLVITAEGASAAVALDDVTAFFRSPSPWHLWLYLLLPVLALYGLSTLLATWDSVLDAWRAGRRRPSAYAPALIHVAFLGMLLAHGVGGFLGAEHGVVRVGPWWTDLPGGRQARALDVQVDAHPDGSPRQVTATLEVRDPDGTTDRREVAYNRPLIDGLGRDLLLLVRAVQMPGGQGGALVPVVVLRARHAPGNPWALASAVLLGLGLLAMGRRWG
ncbi:MAG TPA: hypothetical protein PLQ97_06700 [Myxococcota bacterium]|nr:hypothetical protein [Myxococcota bacterium]HQK50631.1 hypothetical protein [Myxococcota bacterium]